MKVLNLRCSRGHCFEGWFTSDEDVQAQLGVDTRQGTLACPLCGDGAIARLPSAPHVVVGGASPPAARDKDKPPSGTDGPVALPAGSALPAAAGGPLSPAARQAAWMHRVREVIAATEDVGERFADEARRMHYGEVDERAIRGRATPEQARELVEEGIEIVALPLPEAFKERLQ